MSGDASAVRSGYELDDVPPRLALALDLADLERVLVLACLLRPYFAIAKVGLELYTAAGATAVERVQREGFEVFVDLKLHDIPTTVERAAAVLGRLGARYVTLHTSGGEAMLRAGVAGLDAGAASAGCEPAVALGVTILTSAKDAPAELVISRAQLAASTGCRGVVCAAPDLDFVRSAAPQLVLVVPGTRPSGSAPADQARIATPEYAAAHGANMLVIGRAVTAAADPVAAARELVESLARSGETPVRAG